MKGAIGVIVDIAGVDTAMKIARRFRGTYLYVPEVEKVQRDERIRRQYDAGRTARQLALAYGLTERHIRRILKGNGDNISPSLEQGSL